MPVLTILFTIILAVPARVIGQEKEMKYSHLEKKK